MYGNLPTSLQASDSLLQLVLSTLLIATIEGGKSMDLKSEWFDQSGNKEEEEEEWDTLRLP
eukprot:scaffold64234_cov47-Attheya_sp.AAC.1